jgi:dihydrodipicolinate reductase
MNIAVTGATGRMGRTVIETATDHQDVTVAFGIDPDVESGEVAGVRVYHPSELERRRSRPPRPPPTPPRRW